MKLKLYIFLVCTAVAITIASCAFMRGSGMKAVYSDGEHSVVLSTDSMKWRGHK